MRLPLLPLLLVLALAAPLRASEPEGPIPVACPAALTADGGDPHIVAATPADVTAMSQELAALEAQAMAAPNIPWYTRYVLGPAARFVARAATRLRYDVRVRGLANLDTRGGGMLVLPNHPAGFPDPTLQYLEVSRYMRIRPVVYEDHFTDPKMRWLANQIGALIVPSENRPAHERKLATEILVNAIVAGLERGENFLIYPEGQLSRGLPTIVGKSLIHRIMARRPRTRLVLSQMNGMLGSSFGASQTGEFPDLARTAMTRGLDLLRNWLLWTPRRDITMRYREVGYESPDAFTQLADNFYRTGLLPPRYVPYRWNEPRTVVTMPYVSMPTVTVTGNVEDVPAPVHRTVLDEISRLAGGHPVTLDDDIGRLGIDSLSTLDLMLFLEKEARKIDPNFRNNLPVSRVRDAVLVAGAKMAAVGARVPAPDGRWIRDLAADQANDEELSLSRDIRDPIEALFHSMRTTPDKVFLTDGKFGAVTFRDFGMMLKLFLPHIQALKGDTIGVMLPAAVADALIMYGAWLTGKKIINLNFTADADAIKYVCDKLGIESIVSSSEMMGRLTDMRGAAFTDSFKDKVVTLESLREKISTADRVRALLWKEKRDFWRELPRPRITRDMISAYLMTSGSSGMPKIVPYTFGMEMTNIRDVIAMFGLRKSDRVLHAAPPFHAIGHRLMLAAITLGVPTVFYPDPGAGPVLAKIIEMYGATVVAGTPKIATGIARSAAPGQLRTLRIMVTGGSKLTDEDVAAIFEAAPHLKQMNEDGCIVEGYGLTEIAPVALVNPVWESRLGTLGMAVPSIDAMVVSTEKLLDGKLGELTEIPVGQEGVLLLAAKDENDSPIMDGYVHFDEEQPFVRLGGRKWYVTYDLVKRDPQAPAYFIYLGRADNEFKRFGEKIQPERNEALLSGHPLFRQNESDKGPVVAIINTPAEADPDIVVYTTRNVTLEQVNRALREAGASQVVVARKVLRMKELPVVGADKLRRKALKKDIAKRWNQPGFWDKTEDDIAELLK